jgi:hypothetical protein
MWISGRTLWDKDSLARRFACAGNGCPAVLKNMQMGKKYRVR